MSNALNQTWWTILKLYCARRTKEYIHELEWKVLLHPLYLPDIVPIFLMTKKLKIWMMSKMPPRNILLKNQLIFIDLGLKICTLDGKKLLIKWISFKNATLLSGSPNIWSVHFTNPLWFFYHNFPSKFYEFDSIFKKGRCEIHNKNCLTLIKYIHFEINEFQFSTV